MAEDRAFPELPLHASTQMTLVMGESTDILERHGITRIVPARELWIICISPCSKLSSTYIYSITSCIYCSIHAFNRACWRKYLWYPFLIPLLAINLSDDYHKAQKSANDLRMENEQMGKEIFDMKHEMISIHLYPVLLQHQAQLHNMALYNYTGCLLFHCLLKGYLLLYKALHYGYGNI